MHVRILFFCEIRVLQKFGESRDSIEGRSKLVARDANKLRSLSGGLFRRILLCDYLPHFPFCMYHLSECDTRFVDGVDQKNVTEDTSGDHYDRYN